jgi:CRISPR-associated protein Cas2
VTVIVLTACPVGLRGHLTQWLLEISAGVYVGHISARVRERLWARVLELAGPGRALMVYQLRGEQRMSFKVHDHHWEPADYDGITLMRRPNESRHVSSQSPPGWSKASQRHRFGRRTTPANKPGPPEAKQSE